MPAGERILISGVGLTNKELFDILNPDSYIIHEDQDKYIDWSYSDEIEKILNTNLNYKGKVWSFNNNFVSCELNKLDEVAFIYGCKIFEYEIFEDIEFDPKDLLGFPNYKLEFLNKKYNLNKELTCYSIYQGD